VHRWFETTLVEGIAPGDVRVGPDGAHGLCSVPSAVDALLADSLAQVPRLYALERRSRLEHDDGPERTLVRERLVAGATLVVRLWRTAWQRSGGTTR
jgi:hypothetical protein